MDLELFSLLERVRSRFGGLPLAPVATVAATEAAPAARRDYRQITTAAELEAIVEGWLRDKPLLAFDIETTGLDPMRADLVGASFSEAEGKAIYVSMDHLTGEPRSRRRFERNGQPLGGGTATFLSIVADLLEFPGVPKTGQNAKYDALVYLSHGIEVRGIRFDTLLAAYLLNPGDRTLSLDNLARDYLKLPKIPTADLLGKGREQITMREVEHGTDHRICLRGCGLRVAADAGAATTAGFAGGDSHGRSNCRCCRC